MRVIFTILLSLLLASPVFAAVALVDDATITSDDINISTAFNNTCVGNCFLVVLLGRGADATPTCTYNSVSVPLKNRLNSSTAAPDLDIFGLAGPASGSNTLACATLTGIPWSIRILTFSGVDQSSPWGTCAENQSSNATSSSVQVNSAVGGMVVDALNGEDNMSTGPPTAGAGQTDNDSLIESLTTSSADLASSIEAGAATVTMSWTTIPTFTDFVHVACPITAAVTRRPIAPIMFQ